jgi:uncharacterized membrane protein
MSGEESRQPFTPRAELLLSRIVLGGAVLSAILFALGIIPIILGSSDIDPKLPVSLDSIIASMASLDAMGLIGIGMIVVVATPLARIVATMLLLSKSDRRLIVLPIITFILIIAGFILRM